MDLTSKFREEYHPLLFESIIHYDLSLANFILEQFKQEIEENFENINQEERIKSLCMYVQGQRLIGNAWEIAIKQDKEYLIK